jgi:hypothetical protein
MKATIRPIWNRGGKLTSAHLMASWVESQTSQVAARQARINGERAVEALWSGRTADMVTMKKGLACAFHASMKVSVNLRGRIQVSWQL